MIPSQKILGVVPHAYNQNSWEVEAGGFKVILCYIRSWSQPGPHETLERESGGGEEEGVRGERGRERQRIGSQQLD